MNRDVLRIDFLLLHDSDVRKNEKFVKYLKNDIRKDPDRFAKPMCSMQDELHHVYGDEGEIKEFGFFEVEAHETDEEIREQLEGQYWIPYHYRDYDCTGQRFSCWLHMKRLSPTLISFAHATTLDI